MLSKQADIKTLLSKKMDRKEFIRAVAIGLVAATGAASVLRSLTNNTTTRPSTPDMPQGYGASAYGGVKLDK